MIRMFFTFLFFVPSREEISGKVEPQKRAGRSSPLASKVKSIPNQYQVQIQIQVEIKIQIQVRFQAGSKIQINTI